MMKICSQCNKKFEEDMNYCPYCGTKYHDYHDDLKEAMDELYDEKIESSIEENQSTDENSFLNKILIFLIIAILIVAIVGIMLVGKNLVGSKPPVLDPPIVNEPDGKEEKPDPEDDKPTLPEPEENKSAVIDITNQNQGDFYISEFKVTKEKENVRFDIKSESTMEGEIYLKDEGSLNVGPIHIRKGSGSFYFIVNGKTDYVLSCVMENKDVYEYKISKEKIKQALKK